MKTRNKLKHRSLRMQMEDIDVESSIKSQIENLSQQITLLMNGAKGF